MGGVDAGFDQGAGVVRHRLAPCVNRCIASQQPLTQRFGLKQTGAVKVNAFAQTLAALQRRTQPCFAAW